MKSRDRKQVRNIRRVVCYFMILKIDSNMQYIKSNVRSSRTESRATNNFKSEYSNL